MELYLIKTGKSTYDLYSKKKLAALLEDKKEEPKERKGIFSRILDSDIVDKVEAAEKYVNNKVFDRFPRIKKVNSYGTRMVRAYKNFLVGSHGQIYLDIMQKKQPIDIYYSPSIKEQFAKHTYLRLVRREIIKQVSLCILAVPMAVGISLFPPQGITSGAILLALTMYSVKTALSANRSTKYLEFKEHKGLGILEDVLEGKLPAEKIEDEALLEYYGKRQIKKKR